MVLFIQTTTFLYLLWKWSDKTPLPCLHRNLPFPGVCKFASSLRIEPAAKSVPLTCEGFFALEVNHHGFLVARQFLVWQFPSICLQWGRRPSLSHKYVQWESLIFASTAVLLPRISLRYKSQSLTLVLQWKDNNLLRDQFWCWERFMVHRWLAVEITWSTRDAWLRSASVWVPQSECKVGGLASSTNNRVICFLDIASAVYLSVLHGTEFVYLAQWPAVLWQTLSYSICHSRLNFSL